MPNYQQTRISQNKTWARIFLYLHPYTESHKTKPSPKNICVCIHLLVMLHPECNRSMTTRNDPRNPFLSIQNRHIINHTPFTICIPTSCGPWLRCGGCHKEFGEIPDKEWQYGHAYSLGYHRHAPHNRHLPADILKSQCSVMGINGSKVVLLRGEDDRMKPQPTISKICTAQSTQNQKQSKNKSKKQNPSMHSLEPILLAISAWHAWCPMVCFKLCA